MQNTTPLFSIVVPTRNRETDLKNCLDGIALQTFTDYEVLVLDDGSKQNIRDHNRLIVAQYGPRFQWHEINRADSDGSGAGIMRNKGIAMASGRYIAFCDDDDCWHRADHLQVAADSLQSQAAQLYFAGLQIKDERGQIVVERHMTHVPKHLTDAAQIADSGVYHVTLEQILSFPDYAHLDITIADKALLDKIGGFWQHTCYAEEVDLFVRACEAAKGILFRPEICATHFAPEKRQNESVSNSISLQNKRLLEISVYQHLLLVCQSQPALKYATKSLSVTQKILTEELLAENRKQAGACFSRSAFAAYPSLKWGLYSLWISLR